ncbi:MULTISPECIES: class I tRNA ligase family protein [Rhodococcus]|uniref:class I tRNA ligase family protein n=1 Tax=Rhodococcus TaxID=1827 RepID=UPI001C5A0938|nr:class I tRNA ligase family protein [Rhodococcus sp. LW-XY12]QXU55583.1 class I tRNA ligase family protein [Rhodococcus sp. LW-XY12]
MHSDSPAEARIEPDPGKTVIFSTPPTPNGGMHLGHLSGPYIAGDILRRRMASGDRVPHISCFDDHTSYVFTKSRQLGVLPDEVARRFIESIRNSWTQMGIEIEAFDNPISDPDYIAFCTSAIQTLLDNGSVVVKVADALYEHESNTYLHEALVTGQCPVCASPSDGDACEFCGQPHETVQLQNPVSTLNPGSYLETRAEKFLYFQLEQHRDFLEQHANTSTMPERLLALTGGMLAEQLPDIRISHKVAWGIPLDREEVPGHRMYPWFEMGLLYLWLLKQHFGAESLDIRDGRVTVSGELSDAQIVTCFGFDNAYFHTLLFPALFHALHGDLPNISHYVANELLHLDGNKFSTSRNHVIAAETMLKHASQDLIRLYLCMIRPEKRSENFTVAEFERTVNGRFIEPLNEVVENLSDLCAASFGGAVPEPDVWNGTTRSYSTTMARRIEIIEDSLSVSGFSTQRATRELITLLDETRTLLTATKVLVGTPGAHGYVATAVALAAAGVDALGRHLAPICPEVSRSISEATVHGWKPLASIDLSDMRS